MRRNNKKEMIEKHKKENEFKDLMHQLKSSFIGESECELV